MSTLRPVWAVVLGSGFLASIQRMTVDAFIEFSKLPGFPPVRVAGHRGRLLVGRLGETPVYVLEGRAHFYEGCSMDEVTGPIRVLAAAGVRNLLLTNAAGAINRRFHPGEFMVVRDHINLMGANPLRGASGHGFVDMTAAYDAAFQKALLSAGRKAGLIMRSGVYLAVSGPSYETPAEIRAFSKWGADAVGMSTVPEVIVARQLGLRVAALSCLTNYAAGLGHGPVSHEEVLSAMRGREDRVGHFLERIGPVFGR